MMTPFRRLTGITAGLVLLTTTMLCAADAPPAPDQPPPARTAGDDARLRAVRTFADNVLAQGRDRWSGQDTPLLADGVNVDTGEPVVWRHGGRSYLIHNLASQQNLFRVLVGLTNLTGDERYKTKAMAAIRYHFDHLASPCGKLRWGGHQFIDLQTLKPVGHFDANCHEFKANFPFYELMWEVNPEHTARFLRALWAGHVTDWRMLMMNRHAPYGSGPAPGKAIWERPFANPEPYFESSGLSFLNCGADLIYGGAMLYHLGGEQGALDWALYMANMYTKARHPDTGMGAYQYTKPRRRREPPAEGALTGALTFARHGDRIENKFGHSGSSDPDDEFFNPVKGKIADDGMLVVREGWVWSTSGGFPWYTLMQLDLAERIGAAARVLAEDAADHLEAHARHAYDPEANHFRPMWADGTDVTGLKIPRTGYGRGNRGDAYDPNPVTPRHLAAYARAHRLTRRPLLWQTVRSMALGLGLGDPGELPGENPSLRIAPDNAEPEAIFALLEMFKTESHPAYLEAARKLADNIVEQRFHKGFFLPSESHYNANFDAVEPLAILAVEAAIVGRLAEFPPYIAGRGYIHGRFDGHGRTSDHRVIWNQTR